MSSTTPHPRKEPPNRAQGEPAERRPGRRPGRVDTRGEIVAAARASFIAAGYEGASLRSIARLAGVDPALIHHYFDGKQDLFMAAMQLARDPADIAGEVQARGDHGADLVRFFLEVWESDLPWDRSSTPPFVSAMQAVCSSVQAADGFRQFLDERVWSAHGDSDGRHALVASQLIGLGYARYVLRIEPVASAPIDDVAAWIGPTIDRYFRGDFDPPLTARAPTSTTPAPPARRPRRARPASGV